MPSTDTSTDQYDSPWKEVIERYFPEFMAFYFREPQPLGTPSSSSAR